MPCWEHGWKEGSWQKSKKLDLCATFLEDAVGQSLVRKLTEEEILRLGNHIWLPAREDRDERIVNVFLKDDLVACKQLLML